MSDGKKIIIVKKVKDKHDAHHGGSWKVAYADFVTAMMAFFMVMWIMGMDQGAKDMVQGYFQNPVGFKRSFSGGRNILSQGNSITSMDVQRTMILLRRTEEEDRLKQAAQAIEFALGESGLDQGDGGVVEVVVTRDGLRIEMMEVGLGEPFFDRSSARLKPALTRALEVVGSQIMELSNGIVIEGHTDATRFAGRRYSNWELSVDRANAARRVLIASGLSDGRLMGVRGYADRELRVVDQPDHPTNRRITLLLPFDTPDISALEARIEDLLRAGAAIAAAGGDE
jgi:chemotaxis protein MotB